MKKILIITLYFISLISLLSCNMNLNNSLIKEKQPFITKEGITFVLKKNYPMIDNKSKFVVNSLKNAIFVELKRVPDILELSKKMNTMENFNLYLEIDEKVKREPLFANDVKNLTKIETQHIISDLTGIEYCKNLKQIKFYRCLDLLDLKPLSNLVYLETIIFNQNDVDADLSPLVNLVNLNSINFDNCQFKNLLPLLTLQKNGGLKKGSTLSILNNNLNLKEGTQNRFVVDKLIKNGVNVLYEKGNTTK